MIRNKLMVLMAGVVLLFCQASPVGNPLRLLTDGGARSLGYRVVDGVAAVPTTAYYLSSWWTHIGSRAAIRAGCYALRGVIFPVLKHCNLFNSSISASNQHFLAGFMSAISLIGDVEVFYSVRKTASRPLFWSLVASGLWHASTAVGHGVVGMQLRAKAERQNQLRLLYNDANNIIRSTLGSSGLEHCKSDVQFYISLIQRTVLLYSKWLLEHEVYLKEGNKKAKEDKEQDPEEFEKYVKELKEKIIPRDEKGLKRAENQLQAAINVLGGLTLNQWCQSITDAEQTYDFEKKAVEQLQSQLLHDIDTVIPNGDLSSLPPLQLRIQAAKNRYAQAYNAFSQFQNSVKNTLDQIKLIQSKPPTDFDN
ncbi:TPA: hypothetical protein DDZ86_01850 [Candidatus Dependentiae bacterium]|nr:MAG: hypothetical protein UW09_C0001G0266 [candidate division TM6 bacterium GW2011_GWF2_43_87]HBL98368.1 hypothetical protein [Candidatus Dependentiae bacterium]